MQSRASSLASGYHLVVRNLNSVSDIFSANSVGPPDFVHGHLPHPCVHSLLGDLKAFQHHMYTDNSQLLPQILAVSLTFLLGWQIDISTFPSETECILHKQTNTYSPPNLLFQQASHFSGWKSHPSSFSAVNLAALLVSSPSQRTCNPLATQLALFFQLHKNLTPSQYLLH